MLRRRVNLLLGAALVALTLGAVAGCSSRHVYGAHVSAGYGPAYPSYRYGPAFYAGGFAFRVGHASHGRYGGYYFRSPHLGLSRRYCGRACYTNRSYHYHHRDCRHVRRYLSRYGYGTGAMIDRYGPR